MAATLTLVVVVGMRCYSLLCVDQRTMLGHRRFSLSDSELNSSASPGSFYYCLCVLPAYSLIVSAMLGCSAILSCGSTVFIYSCSSCPRSMC
ncbi:unnamed protein product [Prunus armeniaca]